MEVLDKIRKDIAERSIYKNIKMFPQTGGSSHEFDYRYCTSALDKYKDMFFVVSKIYKYQGNSLSDFGFMVYPYDKNGNFIDDPEFRKKCEGNFFGNLKDIE